MVKTTTRVAASRTWSNRNLFSSAIPRVRMHRGRQLSRRHYCRSLWAAVRMIKHREQLLLWKGFRIHARLRRFPFRLTQGAWRRVNGGRRGKDSTLAVQLACPLPISYALATLRQPVTCPRQG